MSDRYLCIHGHFYQPPREDPFTGETSVEIGAAPYRNWNERITAECYRPNARLRNFEQISFNVGPTLAAWLEIGDPDTYRRIIAADRWHQTVYGVGNALAQGYHHAILPLASERDRCTEVAWGIYDFTLRFGHGPHGFWLPEMAVDLPTLETLARQGIRFTILSDEQVEGDLDRGAGPYWVRLPSGRRIAVFVRHRDLSNLISFDLGRLGTATDFARRHLPSLNGTGPRSPNRPYLVLIATDGETFGHHQMGGAGFLDWLVHREAEAAGWSVTTLARFLRDFPPDSEVTVVERTSWSCAHGLARWSTGCACTPGDSRWKQPLRQALNRLAHAVDEVYAQAMAGYGLDPWGLRNDYIRVVLGQVRPRAWLQRHIPFALTRDDEDRLLALLEAQRHRLTMFTSCAFFFEELTRVEPRYAIANAIRAIELTQEATGEDLGPAFRRDLERSRSRRTGVTGADLFDAMVVARAANVPVNFRTPGLPRASQRPSGETSGPAPQTLSEPGSGGAG